MFTVVANLDLYTPLSGVTDAARRAEALGFDRLSIPDVCHDGLTAAAIAVGATTRIDIANSALVCFPRSPMTTAVAVWDLQAFSGGRYHLGLGPLVAPNIIQKYSTPWHPPAPRMREYVQTMRAIFRCWQTGEPLAFRGEYYQFLRQQAYIAPPPIEHPDIPLHLAAVGPHMAALAGELADAITTHPTNTSPRFIQELLLPDLAKGAARTGRSVGDMGVIVNPLIATGSSAEEINRNREAHRQLLATILSTPNYWRSLELFGWGQFGPALRQLTREGKWDAMPALLDDDILDAFVISAPWSELAATIRTMFNGCATHIGIALPQDCAADANIAAVIAELKA
ncbi:putative oxidoreductase [Caenibius tardaugens NBRC 16725]|uniref:Putative oxidoreductase n=1 Tax=Caenibius tardaugens NBRC 16725 TaxID=1219035 RepID=U2ZYN3_9SPHN|nr:TIGR03617 family F420-dependent LLM class oxidoreductase [Caenibius tardaugens]AZI35414.1 TIGR03617 family F420-dependent LLM class oxidoreductase [Caenibius tardaugens NBRC 16725]GAD50494.1 putative oxidoreductase [Caenibius tardaugens NBRC 16725]